MALMVVAIIFGLRILTYIIARCMIRRRQQPESSAGVNHEFEMRVASAALAMHRHQREWRRQAVEATEVPPSPAGEWHSKLVITAGSDRASYIAHPCPLWAERLG
ncbi:hypothetical protein MA16_Dca007123 [Dendrobium catenatum]|uniref:Uncharacterized protein n=1 Tax=Dendrobium catenatum TaxID=906689 RepID=A0A2I0W3Y5_9ASPA|nr:hypothetical protein MA16_Dca007123 [Dendrobium catenatum]